MWTLLAPALLSAVGAAAISDPLAALGFIQDQTSANNLRFQQAQSAQKDLLARVAETEQLVIAVETFASAKSDTLKKISKKADQIRWRIEQLCDYDETVAQLISQILDLYKNDPFSLNAITAQEIGQFFVIVNLYNSVGVWQTTSERPLTIIQTAAVSSDDHQPTTALLLRSHRNLSGFAFASIKLSGESLALRGVAAAGLLIKYVDEKNFVGVELAIERGGSRISVNRNAFGQIHQIGSSQVLIETEKFIHLLVRSDKDKIQVFVDGKKKLIIDLQNTPQLATQGGFVGLYCRHGKAAFATLTVGPLTEESSLLPLSLGPLMTAENEIKSPNISAHDIPSDTRFTQLALQTEKILQRKLKISSKQMPSEQIPESKQVVRRSPESKPKQIPESNQLIRPESKPKQGISTDEQNVYEQPESEANCLYLHNRQIQLDNFEPVKSHWNQVDEFGITRLRPKGLVIDTNGTAIALQRDSFCVCGTFSVFLRLDNLSTGGLLFRYDSESSYYGALIESGSGTLALIQVEKHGKRVLASKSVRGISADRRHYLVVSDGPTLSIYLDGVLEFEQKLQDPATGGRQGLFVERGSAAFDTFGVAILDS